MKLYFLKEDALNTLRGNINNNIKQYSNPTNEWIYEFFKGEEPFGEFKHNVDKFELAISLDKPEETDIENIKILYTNLKMLTDSQATDERLWSGLAHNNFWQYMSKRWGLDSSNYEIKDIKNWYFFSHGKIRSLIRHPLAKLWWAGRNTYDEKRDNPFELTEFLKGNFYSKNLLLFSSNFSNNKMVVRSLLGAMVDIEKDGNTISRNVFEESIRYLNIIGGTYILDYFEEEELKEKIKLKIKDLIIKE